jgi:hypothetical protein
VTHEVNQELVPGSDPETPHVAHREREGMINADDHGLAALNG